MKTLRFPPGTLTSDPGNNGVTTPVTGPLTLLEIGDSAGTATTVHFPPGWVTQDPNSNGVTSPVTGSLTLLKDAGGGSNPITLHFPPGAVTTDPGNNGATTPLTGGISLLQSGGGGGFPWDSDATVTNAYLADASYQSGSNWLPQKGAVTLTGVSVPTYSSTGYGSGNKGQWTIDGTSQYFTADSLAAGFTGNTSYAVMVWGNVLGVSANRVVWALNNTTSTAHYDYADILTNWRSSRIGTATAVINSTATAATVGRHVLWIEYDGVGNTKTIRVDGAATSVTAAACATAGTFTPTRFTLGVFRGATNVAFINMAVRGMLICVGGIPSGANRTAYENYALSENA